MRPSAHTRRSGQDIARPPAVSLCRGDRWWQSGRAHLRLARSPCPFVPIRPKNLLAVNNIFPLESGMDAAFRETLRPDQWAAQAEFPAPRHRKDDAGHRESEVKFYGGSRSDFKDAWPTRSTCEVLWRDEMLM